MIQIQDLTKSFDEKVLFQKVSFSLNIPGTAALTGDSGSGKTTLARILLNLDRRYEGAVIGVPSKKACVFQEDRLLPALTAAQNVLFVNPSLPHERLAAAFEAVELRHDMNTPAAALSGGMQRRVSIIRALLSDAEFIVMDEPLKGMDDHSAKKTAAFIQYETQSRTMLYITHTFEELDWLNINERWHLRGKQLYRGY